jgi:hypothetical protein
VNSFVIPLAHGIGGRSDLPLPGWLFSWGAAVVLAVSFFGLAALWNEPKLETAEPKRLFGIPSLIEPLCGLIGLLVFSALVWFGFAGEQDIATNILPTVLFVFFWTMLPMASALFGDIFRPFNPWRFVGLTVHRLRVKLGHGEQNAAPRFVYPGSLGRWPAMIGLLAFGWIELVSGNDGKKPELLATLALAYFAFQLLGMSLFGARRWLDRGDAFGVYFEFFSRISPLTVRGGKLCWRTPLSGLTDITPAAGTVAFVATMIGITVYDGVERGGIWQSIAGSDPSTLVKTLGLIGAVLLVAGFYRLGVLGMEGAHIGKTPKELSEMFAPSLIPIALGYLIAHYFSFMVFTGQALAHVIAHPMGDAGEATIDYFMSNKTIWWIQVVALLAGHVAGLVVAHDKATAVWGKARAAAQSQTWMLVVMVGFTSLGLWLLSQSG